MDRERYMTPAAREAERRLDPAVCKALRGQIRGEVVAAGDPTYDSARRVFNSMYDSIYPAIVVRCLCAHDIIQALEFAHANDLSVAVRGGGHNPRGFGTCDGLVIDVSLMRGVVVRPEERRVFVQGGAVLGDLDTETTAYGLVVPSGSVSHTGLIGLTLGGGFGQLTRRHALACDNVVSAQLVTAAGEVLDVTEETHPDLLWALRGGGGGLGVVTSLEYQAFPIGRAVLAGTCAWPLEDLREVLPFYREFVADAPRELGINFIVAALPERDFISPSLRGRTAAMVSMCWSGDIEAGSRVLDPLRTFRKPLADTVGVVPYTVPQSHFDWLFPSGRRAFMKSGFLPTMTDDVIEAVAGFAKPPEFTDTLFIEIQALHGAFEEVSPEQSAFGYRSADFLFGIVPYWDDPRSDEAAIGFVRSACESLAPFTEGTYTNYQSDTDASTVESAWEDEQYARLSAVKARYDPERTFQYSHNVPSENRRG